jgi:hypothetical protein
MVERVANLAVPSDSDDWKRQPSLQGLSPRRPLVVASYDPAADFKYPSDALWSPSLAARAILNVAIPSSRAARVLGRLPSRGQHRIRQSRIKIPAPQHPSASETAKLTPGYLQPRFSRTSNRIRLCQRRSADRAHRRCLLD